MNIDVNIDDRNVGIAISNEIRESLTKYGSALRQFICEEAGKIVDAPDFQEKIRANIKEIAEKVSSEIIHSVVSEVLKKKIKTIVKEQSEQGDLFKIEDGK